MYYFKKFNIFALVLFLTSIASATIINIPDDYATIQEGIDSSIDGDTILVQPGTYTGGIHLGNHDIVLCSFFLTSGDISFIEETIISGGSGVNCGNGITRNTMITGLTITNGGGVIGGGICCHNGGSPVIKFNYITGNYADAMMSAAYGGGIACIGNSNPLIIMNIIDENSAGDGLMPGDLSLGGGIYIVGSSPEIYNNVIANNGASIGGGIYANFSTLFIVNSVIYNNYTDGAAVDIDNSSDVTLINSILRSPDRDYPMEFYASEDCTIEISFCNVEDSVWPGEGNIDIDPLFRDPENGDFHLMATYCGDPYDSPCIDMGKPTILDSLIDCDWGLGGIRSDMGAYSGGGGTVDVVDDELSIPQSISLSQNYPNPFNASTIIKYELPCQSEVSIDIYDILGRWVILLQDGYQPAGYHQVTWRADDLSSGLYFYKIQAGEYTETKKMMLIK